MSRPTQTTAAYDATAAAFADRWFDTCLGDAMARFTGQLGPGARVLDVGCGPGRDVAQLAGQGFDAIGIDLSLGMLRQGLLRGVSAPLIQADMTRLPFRRGSFKGLWVCASLLHIPKSQAGDVLAELGRVVCPGHIYISVKRGQGERWVEDREGHSRFFVYYAPAEIQLLIERSGFEILACWENPGASSQAHTWINVLGASAGYPR